MNKAIIFANGRPPKKSVIAFLKKKGFGTLICADGGANAAKKLGIVPDYIIGDLDSALPETLNYFEGRSEIIRLRRQNDTDVEKCLKHAVKLGCGEAVMVGVTGNRLDHTFCNLGIVLKFLNSIKLTVIAENSVLTPFTGSGEFDTEADETISLYGFNRDTLITTKGFKYPLKGDPLPFGERESTSNRAKGRRAGLTVEGGVIFIVRDYETVKRNDFL